VQFHHWKVFTRHNKLILIIALILGVVWIAENLFYSTISSFNYVFLIAYSFVLALLSIYTINTIVVALNRPLFKNSMFIICVGLVIYFIYTIIVFTLLLVGGNKQVLREVFEIKVDINALVNLIYAVAVYFIPVKTKRFNFFDEITMKDNS
jgi:hypothetical protein